MGLASKAVTSYQPHPVEVDLGMSDTRLVTAKTVIAYGDSGLGKSTNFRYAAQWLYELTSLPVRLISAEDSSKQIFEPLIQIGVVQPLFLTKSQNPIPTLRRLSRGEWPVFEGGIIKSWLPWNKSCSGYILEGLSSIAEQIQEDCREKGRFLGEQKENTYIEGGETITLAGRFSYGFVQLEVIRLLRGFAMIDGIERVFWSAHESKGVEEGSNLQIRGPQLVGSAKTGSVQKYCGLLLHFDGYPMTVKRGELSVIETRVRVWFQRHPDLQFTHISYPAKTTLPVESLARLHDKFPGGYFEPRLEGGKLTPNLADFLAFERSIVSVSTDELAVWKRQVDANLKGEKQ